MPFVGARILKIDLRAGTSTRMDVSLQDQRAFLGAASLGAHLLYPGLRPEADPLDDEAPIALLAGPLTGTAGPATGRAVFCARSPATGLWGESNIGGFLGPELRAAGYDGLWITGRSPEPVYLWLHDGTLEFRPAADLWGKADTYETQELIRAQVGERRARVACIGLAGEGGVTYASILCDHGRAAGRTGMGALLGSKRVKAIALRGHAPMPLHDPEAFGALRSKINAELKDDNVSRTIREAGTASGLDYWNYLGSMPAYYYTRPAMETVGRVSGGTVAETILSGVKACHACVIACGREVRLVDGIRRKGPEYETTVGFGPLIGVDDIGAITHLGELCDRYGMATISTSNVIGFCFLAYERGLLKASDTDGLALEWGDVHAAEQLVHQIAHRQGLGERLAHGVKAVAVELGVPEMASQVNNLETAYHDPRGASGMALVYATSPRGACHNQSDYFWVDTLGQAIDEIGVAAFDRQAGAEKAASVAIHQDWITVMNSLVMCIFANVPPPATAELINRATGFDYSLEELVTTGRRGWTLKRMVNHRLGLTAANDRLPGILMEPLPAGGSQGYVPPLREMLAAYYQARGWDPGTGRPTRETLRTLGLEAQIDG